MRRIGIWLLFAMTAAAQQPALRDYGRLPLVFEPNQGQVDSSVKFLARAGGGMMFFTEREMVVAARGAKPVRMRLAGSRKPEAIQGLEPTGGISNYFIGNDPAKWRTKIPNYGRVEYKSVYTGVDLVYYGNPQKLEYDLVVAPGADASVIQVEYDGVESLRVDTEGDLVLATAAGELRQKRPVAYQQTTAGRVDVEVSYRLKPGRRVAFELARYDTRQRLVIDPVFLYSTYLGGSNGEVGFGIALDGTGNAYVTGQTGSANFPSTNPIQGTFGGGLDAFVTKINAAGSARVYSTYIGGIANEAGQGIAVDGAGNAYLTGFTESTNFPTANPMQVANAGNGDAFVTKINAAGTALMYSTYLGGSGPDSGSGIAVDSLGRAFVTGATQSSDFPTTFPIQLSHAGGGSDAFVTVIGAQGSTRLYSTYLGGSDHDWAYGIALDREGNAYVTGVTASTDFPTTNPIQSTNGGGFDAFVTKISGSLGTKVYSTYLGGSGTEFGLGIAVDSGGKAYVTGRTNSTNFPTTNPSQVAFGGGAEDVFVTLINAAGSTRLYSTYLGGSGDDTGNAIAVDGAGNAYVTGQTTGNFPLANPIQAIATGGTDVFVTKINAVGSARVYSTYLGGGANDSGAGVAVDGSGNAYVTGATASTNFPATIVGGNSGLSDTFVSVIAGNSAVAAFRDTAGGIRLSSELTTSLSNAGGTFASDPAVAQNAKGDTYVVARDTSNGLWLNFYSTQSQSWLGWQFGGGNIIGNPSVTVGTTNVFIAARDSSGGYWFLGYVPGSGFTVWQSVGGAFVTDPVIATEPGQTGLYLTGRDASNAIWSNFRTSANFQEWSLGGAAAQGKPAVTMGQDGAAYIAIRDPSNSIWMGRYNASSWSWAPGGGTIASDPQVAGAGGNVYAAALTASGAVWYNTFVAAAGNNWTGWVDTGGFLSSVAAAASTGPQLFLTGRDPSNQLWWYEAPGAGWKFVGAQGVAAGPLSAAPR